MTNSAVVRAAVNARIHPDLFSYTSVIAAGIAGWLLWQSRTHPRYIMIAVAFALGRLALSAFAGMVAHAAGRATRRSELIHELCDRISDVLTFVGVAHSGWCNAYYAYWVVVSALLVAYTGILGQAVGGRRETSGVMAEPWRIVALCIGALITMVLVLRSEPFWFAGLAVLDWTHFVIIAGCAETIAVRIARIVRGLD